MFGPFQITGTVPTGRVTGWLIAVFMALSGAACPVHAEISLSGQQRQWLQDHGNIVVGTTAQGRGIYETWRQGELKGLSVDYLDMLTEVLGVHYRVKSYPNWHDLYLAVCAGQVDLVMTQALPSAAAQQQCISYTRPYFRAMPIVVSRRGSGVMDSADLHGLKLALENQSSLVEPLSSRYQGASIDTYDDAREALSQVRDGGADAFIGDPQAVRPLLETPEFRQLHVVGSINTAARSLVFGIAPGRGPLREALDIALDALSAGQIDSASQTLRASPGTMAKVDVSLSAGDRNRLAQLPTLRVGFPMHEFPYAFFDHYGQPSGIAADFFDMIAQGLGIRFDFIPSETSEAALAQLRQGNVDLIAVSQDSPQDLSTLNTQAYAEAPMVIAVGNSDGLTELRDLTGAVASVDAASLPGIAVKLQRFRITAMPVANATEGLDRVRAGEVRAYIGDLFLLDPLIQRRYVGSVRIAAPAGARHGIAIGLARKYDDLAPLINRILSNLPSGREQRVVSTWLAPQYSYGIPESVFWTGIMPAMLALLVGGIGFGAGYWRLRKEIRRRTEIERQLETARDLAQSQAQARATFLAVMSHEIRTPLSGVLGMLELLARTSMRDDQRTMVGAIDESARALLQILDTVLDYTKVDANQMELERVPVDLRALLANVMLLMGEPARRRGVVVSYDVEGTVPKIALGDPVRIRQVLANLVGNAAKFTHQGEIKVTLSLIRATPDTYRLLFQVADSGVGIAPQALHNLMAPFQQADQSIARKHGGTGLGLAVSLRLAELMGGKITLDSRLGTGTTVRFEFLLAVGGAADATTEDHGQEVDFLLSRLSGDASPTTPPTPGPLTDDRPRALIVEDHRINREMLARQLDTLGCVSEAATDGAAALERLKATPYDLLLTDWQLPTWDGEMLASKWRDVERERQNSRRLPIVLLSAALRPDRHAWTRAGIDAYLRKPVRLEVLRNALSQLLPAWQPPLLDVDAQEPPERGVDIETLAAVCGSADAARQMLAAAAILLRQELEALRRQLSALLEQHWSRDLHRILGALSTLGHWQALDDGEALERAIVAGAALDRTPDILPLLHGLEQAIAEVEWEARQG